MSSEYMRQILESINNAQQITEGYEDRVNDVVSIIKRDYPDGITKKDFPAAVEKAGQESGAVEMRSKGMGGLNQKGIGDSRKEFIKDVAAKIDFRRDTSKTDAKRERIAQTLQRLADITQEAIGNAWPDGDPFDEIFPKARKMGIRPDDLADWLDRAVKKHIGYKSYHDMVASTWDDFKDQTSGIQNLGGRKNPWR